jgi:hypothetical protein
MCILPRKIAGKITPAIPVVSFSNALLKAIEIEVAAIFARAYNRGLNASGNEWQEYRQERRARGQCLNGYSVIVMNTKRLCLSGARIYEITWFYGQ